MAQLHREVILRVIPLRNLVKICHHVPFYPRQFHLPRMLECLLGPPNLCIDLTEYSSSYVSLLPPKNEKSPNYKKYHEMIIECGI